MPELLDRIAAELPHMPRKMAMAAKYALDHPDEIALSSMRSIASQCGVASPTMLRLARHVGFESYGAFKSMFQDAVILGSFRSRAGALQNAHVQGGDMALVSQIARAAVSNIDRTFSGIDLDVIRQQADLLISAPTTYVIGTGAMHWVAAYMQFTGRMALPGLRVPRQGGATLVEALGAITRDDVVLALAISPYGKNTLNAAQYAHENGARVLAITDSRGSPLLPFSSSHILTSSSSPHYFPSIVAVVAVVEALLAVTVSRSDKATLERIDKIEALRRRSGAYLL